MEPNRRQRDKTRSLLLTPTLPQSLSPFKYFTPFAFTSHSTYSLAHFPWTDFAFKLPSMSSDRRKSEEYPDQQQSQTPEKTFRFGNSRGSNRLRSLRRWPPTNMPSEGNTPEHPSGVYSSHPALASCSSTIEFVCEDEGSHININRQLLTPRPFFPSIIHRCQRVIFVVISRRTIEPYEYKYTLEMLYL
jgi:hypothetical protein